MTALTGARRQLVLAASVCEKGAKLLEVRGETGENGRTPGVDKEEEDEEEELRALEQGFPVAPAGPHREQAGKP